MCNIPVSTVDECLSPMKLPIYMDVATFSTKPITSKRSYGLTGSISTNTTSMSITSSSHDCYVPSDQKSSDGSSSLNKNDRNILNVTNYFLNINMKAYLGIPPEWKSLLHLLSTKGNITSKIYSYAY